MKKLIACEARLRGIVIAIICVAAIATGCSNINESYEIPTNYDAEMCVKVYADNIENTYSIVMVCDNQMYDLKITDGDIFWRIMYDGAKCVLKNDKFPNSDIIIEDFKLMESLVYELDLNKFNQDNKALAHEVEYCDSRFKHILTFNKKTFLPEKIFVYKNNNLVKNIVYSSINVNELAK